MIPAACAGVNGSVALQSPSATPVLSTSSALPGALHRPLHLLLPGKGDGELLVPVPVKPIHRQAHARASGTPNARAYGGKPVRGPGGAGELLHERLEEPGAGGVAKADQRFLLDLTHTLTGDPQERADLLQCHGLLVVEAEVEAQDLRLPLLER